MSRFARTVLMLLALAPAMAAHLAAAQAVPDGIAPRVVYGGELQPDRDGDYAIVLVRSAAQMHDGVFCHAFLNHYHPAATEPEGGGPAGAVNGLPLYWPIPGQAPRARPLSAADCQSPAAVHAAAPVYDYPTAAYLFGRLHLSGDGPTLVVVKLSSNGGFCQRGFLDMTQDNDGVLTVRMLSFDRYLQNHDAWHSGQILAEDGKTVPSQVLHLLGYAVGSAVGLLTFPFRACPI